MVDYAIANQIRPFQLPDIAGIAGAMQGLETNRMRAQQLQAAEQERNALRQLMGTPGFDPSSPDAARRLLEVAPTTGAATYQALMAGQREQRQAQTAQTEAGLKAFDLSRESLRGIAALPEADRPRAWAAWRARTEATVPGTQGFIPSDYSDEAYTAMISKADEIARNLTERPTALAGPGGIPVFADRRTGTFRMGTEVSPGAAPPPPAAPGAPAPRAEAPGLTPAQLQAAHMLRGFEGFEGSPYFDRTAFRAGFGSDTTTLADGTVVPVRQGMTVSREDAERDLARRIPEFTQRAERNIGAENFARLPPNAQAALISVAYNYGHIPESLLPAARSGDLTALSQAVAALPANPNRRQSEAAVIAGQGPRLVQANAMAPGAAPANAMLAPDATPAGSEQPILPNFGPPRNMAEAQRAQALQAAVLDLEKQRIEAERARRARLADQPIRVEEAGQTAGAVAGAQANVRRAEQPARVEEAGQTVSAQEAARIQVREAEARRAETEKLNTAIRELERITRPNGLLQRSTGSGVGELVDIAGRFFGASSRGSEAAAALAPIADVVLKLVPRFEGPQSDKDTATYQAASGRLADSSIPNAERLAAAREIIRLMRDRRDQFSYAAGGATAPTAAPAAPTAPPVPQGLDMTPDNWSRLWGVMTPQERALWQN